MKRLIWLFLLASASSQTFNTNIIPAQTGLSLGRQGQRWNLYANNLDITGAITVNGVAGHFTIFPLFGSGHTAVSTDLTSSTPGQCAFWIAGNMLGQGPCLTAVPTPTLGDCAVWATTTTLSSLPCAGGGGSGDLKSLPVSTQTVTQPQSTTLAPNNLQQVRYATNYQWNQSPTSPATIAIGANTVTVNGVLGVNAYSVSKVKHYLWIATQGTPERVLITATTCTGVNTGTCTVTFTAAGTHSAGYTLGTATGGWQEAWVDAFPTTLTNPMVGAKVSGSPTNANANIYVFNAPLDIDMQRGSQSPLIFDGQGSVIACNTSGLACVEIDTGTAGTQYLQPEGLTFENFMFITVNGMGRTANGTTKAIHDKGQKTLLRNIHFDGRGNTADAFDDLIVNDDDQMMTVDHVIMNPGNGPPITCDSTYCGSGIKGTTTNGGAIGYIHNSDLSMQCRGNGVDWQSGNTVHISDSVIQAFNQFGVRAKGAYDTNPAVYLENVYNEVGICTNPLGTGSAGLIMQGAWGRVTGSVGPTGKMVSFTASAVGATQSNYYVVAKSSTLGTSNALLAGFCLHNGTGTCAVKFNQIGSSGTMTWDLIRSTGNLGNTSIAPYTAGCAGGSVSACGSVATAITTASCSNNVCTATDDVTANTTSYTVLAAPTFFPRIDLWPGAIVLGSGGDTNNVHLGSSSFISVDKVFSSTTTGGIVSLGGRRGPSIVADYCNGFASWNSGYAVCQANDPTTAAVDTVADIKHWGGTANKKGRTIYVLDPVTGAASADLITLGDADPALTAASPGNRGANNANDTVIGLDQASGAPTTFRLGYRAPVGHRWYVGSLFDNSSWKMQLSSSGLSLASITGSTQCLHADTTGLISGTGSDCGSGAGSGNVSNSGTPTSGQIPVWQSATTISGVTDLTLPGNVNYVSSGGSGVTFDCTRQAGADNVAKINTCLTAAAAAGKVADAKGFTSGTGAGPLVVPSNVELLLPQGDLTITGASCVTVTDGSAITGQGFNLSRILCTTSGNTGIALASAVATHENVRLRDFALLGPSGGVSVGLEITGMKNSQFHNIWFQQYATSIDCNSQTVDAVYDHFYDIRISVPASGVGISERGICNAIKWTNNRINGAGTGSGTGLIIGNTADTINPNENLFVGMTIESIQTAFSVQKSGWGIEFIGGRVESAVTGITFPTNCGMNGVIIDGMYLNTATTRITNPCLGIFKRPGGTMALDYGEGWSTSVSPNVLPNSGVEMWSSTTAANEWGSVNGTTWPSGSALTRITTPLPTGTLGTYAAQLGDGVSTISGAAATTKVAVDRTMPWTFSGQISADLSATTFRVAYKAYDSAGALITTGTGLYFDYDTDGVATTTTASGTTYNNTGYTCNCFTQNSNRTVTTANTYQRFNYSLKFPANTTSVQIGLVTATTNHLFVDEMSLTPGAAPWQANPTQLPTSRQFAAIEATSINNVLTSLYKIWEGCNSKGLGDGLNAIPAGTYLQFACVNDTGATVTLTGLRCYTDNAGTSTMNAANNAGTGLLTGAVTCNNTKASGGAAGTQSATTTLAAGDAISFTFVADGTSKQTNWTVSATY